MININKKLENRKSLVTLLSLILLLIPAHFSLGADLSKGLFQSEENLKQLSSFLKGGAQLQFPPIEWHPAPIFSKVGDGSINIDVQSDKAEYQAGETVNIQFFAENTGFLISGDNTYYLWTSGNLYAEILRISPDVPNGELVVASGMIFEESDISLYQNQKKEINFFWQIPVNAEIGEYEIRIYPASAGIIFLGSPQFYRNVSKTRINVSNNKSNTYEVEWDLSAIKLNNKNIKLKEQTYYFESDTDNDLSIPLKNNSIFEKKIVILKQLRSLKMLPGDLLNEEKEEILLNPGEIRNINFSLKDKNFKEETGFWANLSFVDPNNNNFIGKNYFDFPLNNVGGEGVIVPIFAKGKTATFIDGIGINTINSEPGFQKGSDVVCSLEVKRVDPQFFYSAGTDRGKESNIKLNLSIIDQNGEKIDEIGYEGPSWDRTGQISKSIKLNEQKKYLKLIGTLSTKDKGEIDRKEIEFNVSENLTKKTSLLEKIINLVKNNRVYLIITSVIVFIIATLATVFIRGRRNRISQKIL